MPEKKPVIVVKKSRLQGAAGEPVSAMRPAEVLPLQTPDTPDAAVENTAQHAAKPFSKHAGINRERMAHFARTFPALWPDFDKGKFRPMKVGIKEQVKAYIDAHPDCGMTFSQWVMAVRVVISRIEYQRCVKEGKTRYDIEQEGIIDSEEGCLSVPGVYAQVKRYQKIKIHALDRNGEAFTIEDSGYLAIVMQHEIDHLHGKVFIDYLSPLKLKMAMKKIKKNQKLKTQIS